MPDVRDILNEGADINPGLPDVPDLLRRGQAARRRRAGTVAVAAAVVAVTSVVAATALLPLRGDDAPQPVTPPTASSLPLAAGPITAGTYDASSVDVDLVFTVPGPGWTLTAVDDGSITLRHGRSTVVLQEWDEVVDPTADPAGPGDVDPVPDDLVAWLTSHPRLDVAGVDQAPVDGQTWTAVEVTVDRALTTTPRECNTLPCVLLAVTRDEPFELLVRDRARVLVAPDRDGSDALVVVLTQPRSRTLPDPAAEQLLATLTTDPTTRTANP